MPRRRRGRAEMALHLFAKNLPPVFAAPDSDGVCPRLVRRVPAWGRTARRRVYARLIRFAIRANAPRIASLRRLTARQTAAESGVGAGQSDGPSKF